MTPFGIDDNNLIIDDKKVSENKVSILPNNLENDQNNNKKEENMPNESEIDALKLTPSL